MQVFASLTVFFMMTLSSSANACCDDIESDFEKSVADLQRSAPDTTLVILGEVIEVRTVFPFPRPVEMKVKVDSVMSGRWNGNVLVAKRGARSSSATFENYIPGKKYLMAFRQEEDENGSLIFTQSICGTYSKLVK